MRNLTVKRTKSFVACLGKMRVYIEDIGGDTVINNVTCRKLGTLKNGEEKHFLIDEEEAKVFVVADSFTKNYCNDFYQLEAGNEDIRLSGKNEFNPATGNAFRFDNNNSSEVAANRKRGENKGVIVLIVSMVIGSLIGTVGVHLVDRILSSRPEEYSVSGMTITLDKDFETSDFEGYEAAFVSDEVLVLVTREGFSLAEGLEDLTRDEYADLVLVNNGVDFELKYYGDVVFFEYEYLNSEDGAYYDYAICMYKGTDAFWLIQFATRAEDYADNRSDILKWASSVRFD